jgi:hypothetical protein
MFRKLLFILLFWHTLSVYAQTDIVITGTVFKSLDKAIVLGGKVYLEGEQIFGETNASGTFSLSISLQGDYILRVEFKDYVTKRIPIFLDDTNVALGNIYLETDLTVEKQDNLITLTDAELLDDEGSASSLALLQSTRDIFLNRAAFDFGQAFFRVRGYDSQNGEVLLNGIPMNKLFDGRPQWNNWGGLNDVIRNQEFTNGLDASAHTFGGILGNTNIDLRPSGLRSGLRLSSSASNRTYTGRVMATYNSGVKENGLAYMVSASRRWAKEGYIDGTLYDAYSFYGALEYQFNPKHSISLTAFSATNRRGRSSAITEEVYELVANRYNPYSGTQNGKIRNSRERRISEPMALFNYFFDSEKWNLTMGLAFQTGNHARSRVGYYNAPNPDPSFYRYLPSFYINSPIGANFVSADRARTSFLNDPQWNWQNIYTANRSPSNNGKAAYVLYDDVINDTQFTARVNGNYTIDKRFKLDFGFTHKNLQSKNYALIADLLGAEYHEDIDPFSDTRNNIDAEVNRGQGQKFNYNYEFLANHTNAFVQLNLDYNKWKGFVSGQYSVVSYQRDGFFQNERFSENAAGKSEKMNFSNLSVKGGLSHKITGRHWVNAHAGFLQRPPLLQNVFINPRESNTIVKNLQRETISTVDLNYYIRMPKLTGRLTGFYTRFQNTTDVNFFFVDSGVGSDFVQEVLTDLDKLHKGLELGLEYQLSAAVKVSAVAALGDYTFASNPFININFDTASADEELIDISGSKDLGEANIKGLHLAQGPQKAIAFGLEYRDPKYWWVGMTANYLANNYANISTITRTNSFYLDPETGQNFPDATPENVDRLLAQKPLDNFYLLNMVGGKSWLKNGKYIGVFASVNNLFDTGFRTGGYEQSRNGNFGQLQRDNLSGSPAFATKYWYGFGRTYFINLAISF